MAWNLSTGMKKALLSKQPSVAVNVISNGISFGDGDGTGSTDTINAASGLNVFYPDDFILIVGGTFNNVMVQALTTAAAKIEVKAGTFTTVASGTYIALIKISTGSVAQILANGRIDVYSGVRPADADTTESGTKLLSFTKDGAAFTAGVSTNGLNLGEFSGSTLQRALDPATGVAEVWRGSGITGGTAGWARWYDNSVTTGASTSAVRMDGVVSTSGGDLNISTGLTIVQSVASEVSTVNLTMSGV